MPRIPPVKVKVMHDRLEEGSRLGPRDDTRKTRPQLIRRKELDRRERVKDVKAIAEQPKILAEKGYKIVSLKNLG